MISAILKYSIGSLFYGGVITVLFLALFIFLIKGWYKDAVFKPVSFIVLGVLFLIIFFHSTIICGALAMKSDITSVQGFIEDKITSLDVDPEMVVDSIQSNVIFSEAVDRHPILKYYAGTCNFSGWTIAQLPATICDTLREYLNGIILKSLLWSLAFTVVAAVIVIKTLDRGSHRRISPRRSGGGTSGREPIHSRRTEGRIASRTNRRRRF